MTDGERIERAQSRVLELLADVERLRDVVKRVANSINEQVTVTRAYTRDSGMDANQIQLMDICTSHFLDYAKELRAAVLGAS